ncbi:MAG: ATP-binding protein [Flavobacteriales bacterium]|nr:ATP-binding protein [Flavobacteriales bacterium]
MGKDFNPFLVSGYRDAEHFCDRKKETKQIRQFIKNGINVTLFSRRRIGKTGLLKHVFANLPKTDKTVCIYVDILGTQNLEQFTNELATAVYQRFPMDQSTGKKVMEFLHKFRPIVTFNELTGTPSVSITTNTPTQQQSTIKGIFTFLDRQNIRVVFAIDEFQQILEYPEKNTEAMLRTIMQELLNTTFIFSGSNHKLMHEIFNSAKRPFFASCTAMYLDFINEKEYSLFIRRHFEERKREITDECIQFICEWTMLHTFYTQYFCNELFGMNFKVNGIEQAREAAINIQQTQENTYYLYRNLLTKSQWKLLIAIAVEEKVYRPNAREFLSTYKLGTPSSVTRSIQALVDKEMIFHNTMVERPYFEVYNKFLMRWMQ